MFQTILGLKSVILYSGPDCYFECYIIEVGKVIAEIKLLASIVLPYGWVWNYCDQVTKSRTLFMQ